ncbi:MAG: extracellular solute-binding protein [Actinobacteria bacterium]|uniref:Unannotated protein n=1 Tax=freshwater metagenome TaxID=449393 RepID=A0A6J7L9H7_9ZZZZ|nr:extracellular solute-binding protein [Actinomycetota bacterium]
MSDTQQPRSPLSRRRLLQATALSLPAAGLLSACARDSGGSGGSASSSGSSASPSATSLQIASPTNPVKWPISAGNEPIAAGQNPEQGGNLQLYSYADYVAPDVIASFEEKYKKYNVKVTYSTFNDSNEALAKLRGGSTPYDVYTPSYDQLGKLVLGGVIQPLQQSYVTDIGNVYAEFQDPFYDQGWQYSAPYTLYTTGIGWRTDKVSEDVGARPNPYDIFWDPKYREKLAVLDDTREAIGMTLLRNGQTDVNTGDDTILNAARDALLEMTTLTKPRVTITGYTDIPEGRLDLSQAWSGDLIAAVGYLPQGVKPDVLRYWFPADGKGMVNNDLMVIPKNAPNPVLAHLFLNHLLDPAVALANFQYVGYQPPQVSLTPEKLVADGIVPANLASALVKPGYFNSGYRLLELPPETDAKWQAIWQQFKAGA